MAFDPFTIGLTVLGGLFSSRSSSKAADANTEALREQLALQEKMFEQTRADYAPWLRAGAPALNEMMRMVGLQPGAGGTGGSGMGGLPTGNTGGGIGPDTAIGQPVNGSLSSAVLNPSGGGLNAPGSMMPGVATGNIPGQRSGRDALSPTIAEYIRGSRPSAHPDTVRSFQNVDPAIMGVNSSLEGNLFGGNRDSLRDTVMYNMAPAVGAVEQTLAPADLNTPLGTIMGNRQMSPNGTVVSGMGTYRGSAGNVVGTISPDALPSDPGIYIPPAMRAAQQRYQEQAAVTQRATGGPIQPGQNYLMGELEPEMLTTPQGSTMINQPTLMQATQPGYVTPGPIGQSLAQTVQTGGSGGAMQPMAGTNPTPNPQTTQPMPQAPQTVPPIEVTTTPQLQADPYSFMSDDPSYGFRFQEGQRALERSAAARGGLLSGGTGRKLTRYGQDYASTEYMNRFNRLASIAGMGQAMTSGMGQLGYGYSGNMGNIIGGIGASQASGYLGQGSAMGGSLQNLAFLNARYGGGG